MNKFYKTVELVANVAIIVVAALVAAVLIKDHLLPEGEKKPANSPAAQSASLVGTKLPLSGIDWTKNNQTFVLALSNTCHYCTESAPLYRQLMEKSKEKGNSRLIALLPQPVGDSQAYIQSLGFSVDEIRQAQIGSIGIKGTPTVLMVNAQGVVTKVWEGKLPPAEESELLGQLK